MNNQSCCSAESKEVPSSGRTFKPQVDVVEKGEALVVYADMPGCDADSIGVNFERGVLTVDAEVTPRHPEFETEGKERLVRGEYRTGNYHRSFEIGENIDASGIAATYEAGVLRLEIPKAEGAKPRRIQVTVAKH